LENYEKLGVFYLGRPCDLAEEGAEDGLVLYDSKDLTTDFARWVNEGNARKKNLTREQYYACAAVGTNRVRYE